MAEIAELLVVVEKLSFFESAILKKDFAKNEKLFLLHSHVNQLTFIGQQGRVKILMITLVSKKILVCLYFCSVSIGCTFSCNKKLQLMNGSKSFSRRLKKAQTLCLGINYVNFLGGHRQQQISHKMNIRHAWQLKKSKSLGKFSS